MRQFSLSLGAASVLLVVGMTSCATTSQTGNLMRANSNLQSGDAQDALEIANFILGSPPANAEIAAQATLIKGLSLESLGRQHEAACVYQFAAESYPNTPSGAQARGRASQLSLPCDQ
jgi:hypothetical protein